MPLDTLQLRNFQCHERQAVEFDPAVTTIVGPSDSGKSALLRALRWLALNRPRGDGFVREGADQAAVRVRLDGSTEGDAGCTVERRKGPENLYKAEGRTYRSFGSDVPEPVAELLKLSELNFQRQHDPPFWFGLTPGEVAKELNAIVDLELIDRSATWLASGVRRAGAEAEVVEGRVKDAEQRLDGLAFVEEVDRELAAVERLGDKAKAAAQKFAEVAASATEAARLREEVRRGMKLLIAGTAALEAGERAERAGEAVQGLNGLLERIGALRGAAGGVLPDLCGLGCLADRAELLEGKKQLLAELLGAIDGVEKNIETWGILEEAGQVKLRNESGGICPVCGGPLK